MMFLKKNLLHPLLSAAVFTVALAFCFYYWGTHSDSDTWALTKEDAWVQIWTNYFYYFGIIIVAALTVQSRNIWPAFVVMVLFCLRELDLHKIYEGQSFLKEPYYVNPDIPLSFKIIGGVLLALLALLAVYFLKQALPLWRAVRARKTWAITIVFTLAASFVSKECDGISRTFTKLHIHESDALPTLVEEMLELVLPVLITLSAVQFTALKDNINHRRFSRRKTP